MMRGVTFVIPTYNEAENLPEVLPRVCGALARADFPFEVLVVDDDSPDGSAEVVERLSARDGFPLRVLRRRGQRGLASAVIYGARAAHFDCVGVLDADLSHSPEDLPRVVGPVLAKSRDLVVGSRYVDGGGFADWPLRRRILSAAGTRVARALAGVQDPLSGFFACRTSLLTDPSLRPRGYKILLEILARNPGLAVEEVAISFRDREAGGSKLRLRQLAEFIVQCSALVLWRARRRMAMTCRRRLEPAPSAICLDPSSLATKRSLSKEEDSHA
jgi:dolichol-phosphate mannosyltransferase